MKDSTRIAVDELVTLLAELESDDDYATANEMVRGAGLDVLYDLATAALVGAARARRRQEVLARERSAQATPTQRANGDAHRRDIEREEEELESWRQTWRECTQLIADLGDKMKVQWEQELLESYFSLSDGTRVRWADATVEQHEERADMFTRNAAANVEGAARHRRAIADLNAANARTLGELVDRPAQVAS